MSVSLVHLKIWHAFEKNQKQYKTVQIILLQAVQYSNTLKTNASLVNT